MANSKGLRDSVRELMNAKKNKLFTYNDLMEEAGLEFDQARTVLYQLWKKGEILQHKVKDDEYGHRYAINISEDNIHTYVQTRFYGKRNSREPLSKEDIETFFQDIQNAFLAFEPLLNKCMDFETRLLCQIEENDKSVELLRDMKERMMGV